MADSEASVDDPQNNLANLTTLAQGHYAQKNYTAAADAYSSATALQAEINGELAPQNADLLYAYGRCLYHLAVQKSDVLGGKVAGEGEEKKSKKRKRQSGKKAEAEVSEKVAEKVVDGDKSDEQKLKDEKNPFLKIEGDDADWDSDISSDDAQGEGEGADGAEEEEADDDLANAFEVLEVARVLLKNRIKDETEDEARMRKTKELLADTHDLQAEIALENERFHDAVTDARAAMDLKVELYPFESSLVAEAHYKLSLALEFASVTSQKGAKTGEATEAGESSSTATDTAGHEEAQKAEKAKDENVDEGMRKIAARHMQSAIESSRMRVIAERTKLESLKDADEKAEQEREVKDVEEIIAEMELRLEDLRNPAVNVASANGSASEGEAQLKGLIGSMLGASPAAQKATIEEATKGANDLTGMIRKKKGGNEGAEKRKADGVESEGGGKRARTEEDTT